MRRPLFRHMLLGACLAAPFVLAGCGSEEGVPQNFPPLRYTYLAPLSLNVGSIQTNVAYVPAQDGTSLDSVSPEPPVQAVEQMIQDRLAAGGGSGTAVITINTASINRVNDTAVGNVSLELQVTSADGHRTGFTNASVTRTRTLPDDTSDDAMRAFLYNMTSELVSAENVELEYQIRRHLVAWLVGGGAPVIGGPAAPTPVQAQPLGGPGAPYTGAPAPLAPPAPLGAPAPASMTVPPAAPGIPSPVTPGAPTPMPTPTMPGGDLGLPQGNPIQPYPQAAPAPLPPAAAAPGAPVPLTPAPAAPGPSYQLVPTQPPAAPTPAPAPSPAPAPAPAPAAPPAPSTTTGSGGGLPPLPPTITP